MNGLELKKFRSKYGLTQKELAYILKKSIRAVQSWEQGVNDIPDSDIELLRYYENEKLKNTPETYKANHLNTVTQVPEDDYMVVEYADLATSAGLLGGEIIADLEEKKTRLIPREYDKGNFLVVRVCGDSMNDGTSRSLKDSDEILIRQWQENIQFLPIQRRLFVVNTNEGSVVKQITEINYKEKFITLHSFNPDFDDYDVEFDEILQIFTVEKIVKSKIEF